MKKVICLSFGGWKSRWHSAVSIHGTAPWLCHTLTYTAVGAKQTVICPARSREDRKGWSSPFISASSHEILRNSMWSVQCLQLPVGSPLGPPLKGPHHPSALMYWGTGFNSWPPGGWGQVYSIETTAATFLYVCVTWCTRQTSVCALVPVELPWPAMTLVLIIRI